jgi:NAD(P)-dependent dehydrogenase (short-subunit alcohol dehydrogenase family)
LADHLEDQFGRLDVLINNAGIAAAAQKVVADTTADEMRHVYDTNVFGVVNVTNALLPLLRRSPSARIVNISSTLGSLTLRAGSAEFGPAELAYCSSKTALNAVTLLYANHLRAEGITVNAVCPGYVATDLNRHSGVRAVEDGAEIAVRVATLDTDGQTGIFVDDAGPIPW